MSLKNHGGYLSEQGYHDLLAAIRNFPSIKIKGKPKKVSCDTICVTLSGEESEFNNLFSASNYFQEPNDY